MIPYREALRLDVLQPSEIRLAYTGSGGKTTAMFQLARQLETPVLVTASTHLGDWQLPLADVHLQVENPGSVLEQAGSVKGVTLVTGMRIEGRRVKGLDSPGLEEIYQLAERLRCPLLVEADGSRRLPLKAPAEYEPAVPGWARQVVVTAGLSALGKPLDGETVHRFERYAALSGRTVGSTIQWEDAARVLLHPEGGLKGIPSGAFRAALLTQVSRLDQLPGGMQMAGDLLQGYGSVLVSAGEQDGGALAVFEPVSAVVLAAGSSSRFGGPKVLVDWRGQPLIRRVVEMALRGGLAQVVVVTGAYHEEVVQALEGLPVQVANNPDWPSGQSASLRTGIRALKGRPGSAVFLLGDQPFITTELIRRLVLEHAHSLAPVVAPQVGGRRANPVLFDRKVFTDLLSVSGDVGGRALFERYPPRLISWHDERLLIDLDTPEDYQAALRLTGQGGEME